MLKRKEGTLGLMLSRETGGIDEGGGGGESRTEVEDRKREGEEAKGRSSSTFQWFWQERFERALADPITDLRILLYIVQMLLEWKEWNITHERTITTRKHERERGRGGGERGEGFVSFQGKIKSDPIVYETTLENETNKFCPLSGLFS